MTRHRLHPTRAAIPAAMLLALVTLAGCAAWKPVPSADPTVAADSVVVVGHGRITLMSGERIDVEHVTVDRDSVRALRIERDRRDTMRPIAPLTQAADAIVVDSSKMDIDEVVEFIVNHVRSLEG